MNTLTTWQWLDNTEKTILSDVNPLAESIVNKMPHSLITEERFFPFTPIGKHRVDQGLHDPWMPSPRIVINPLSTGLVEIRHPQDSSFTKYESRDGITALVRKQYRLNFHQFALACMSPEVRALNWIIYDPSSGPAHFYLHCAIPAPSGDSVSLYVPPSYFRTKDWRDVERAHQTAINYYDPAKAASFRQPADKIAEWRAMVRAALTCSEAKQLRTLIEQ